MGDALRLAQQGYKVIPLHTVVDGACDCGHTPCPNKPGKHPWITGWQKRASDRMPDLARWWTEWPAANIGVVCGLSGAVVVDVDPRSGGIESMDALILEHGELPRGPKAITGSGGFHYYFAHPAGAGARVRGEGGFIENRAGVRPGIDIKADGGQVVAPPSVYATGVMYRWADGYGPELDLPQLPHWLREMITEHKAADGLPRPAYMLPEKLSVGQRHQELVRWGGFMRQKGASESIIFASLMAVNEERSIQSPTDPMTTEEIALMASDVAHRWQPGEAFVYTNQKPEKVRQRLEPYTAADLECQELPAPKWAIAGILPEGLCLFAGPIKLGKSYLILGVAIGVAEGDVVLDLDSTQEGDVLYIALEDSKRRMQTRLRQIHPESGWPERLKIIDLGHGMPRMDEGGLEFVDQWLGQHPGARLVVIDTLQRFRSRQATKKGVYAADVDEIEPLQQLALRHGVAIVCIHHYNKALHDDWVDSISGSSGVGGTADTLWGIDRPRGKSGQKEGRLRITGRDVEEQDLTMALEDYRWRVLGNRDEQETSGDSPAIAELVAYMERRPWETYDAADVQAALNKPTYDAARMLLKRAVAVGIIRKRGRGLFGLPEAATEGGTDIPVRSVRSESEPNNNGASPNRTVPNTEHRSPETDNLSSSEPPVLHPTARERPQPTAPERDCPGCRGRHWSLRVDGHWWCDVCRPWQEAVNREG